MKNLSLLAAASLAVFIAACSDAADPSNLIGPGYYGSGGDTAGGANDAGPATSSGGSSDTGGSSGSGGASSGGSSSGSSSGGSGSGGSGSGGSGTMDAGTSGSSDAGTKSSDAGSTNTMDSGTTTTTTDVFTNAGAFVSQVAATTHHAGQDCMGSCHNHGFTFAGTLTDGAGNGVAGAEVRLVDANGQAISVHTDPIGNFHGSTSWTGPAKVGARNATTKVLMSSTIATGKGCNGCHVTGGTVAPIHIP